jgi:outer membrane protein TolC
MRLILLFLMFSGAARAGEFSVTLKAAEESALAASNQYKSAKFSAEAARAAAAASGSLLYPRLSLEGGLRYNEVVPEIGLPAALGGSRPLGDNWNYSLGPSASWTLFDGGALRSGYKSASHSAASRSAEAENARRQALLKARVAYFQLQLALERVYLIGENLQLSLAQLKDISLGAKAGSRSRLDEIRARQETTARRRDFLRARAGLSASLRDFGFAVGMELPAGAALPLDSRMAGRDYGEAEPASLFVKAEPYETILSRMLAAARSGLERELPSVRALGEAWRAYGAQAGAYRAEKLPRLILGARSSLDYPNGPNLYSFVQNSASLTLSLPLFENGRSSDKEKESALNAAAALEKRDEAALAARRDFDKALDAYNALMAEQTINIEAVDDAAEAAKLAYEAYQAGGGTWLEVESANLKALQTKTTAAETNAEMLLKLAALDSLTGSVKE